MNTRISKLFSISEIRDMLKKGEFKPIKFELRELTKEEVENNRSNAYKYKI